MNLDLLKKLTRLANNNPNDNEVNLAARKVCKMLEEGNWALPTTPSGQQRITITPEWSGFRPHQRQEDFYTRKADWYDEMWKAANEAYKESTRQNEERKAKEQEDKRKAQEERRRQAQQAGNEWYKTPPKWETPKSWNVNFDKRNKESEPKSKRPVECTQCHQMVMTAYVGHPGTYVCYNCQWNNHNQRK